MKIIKFHNKRLNLNQARKLVKLPWIHLVTRPDDPYISETFRKIKKMLDCDFSVFTTKGLAKIEIQGGKVYIKTNSVNDDYIKLLTHADKHRIKVEDPEPTYMERLARLSPIEFITKILDDIRNNA